MQNFLINDFCKRWSLCKSFNKTEDKKYDYTTWASRCFFRPVPEKITFRYAKSIPWMEMPEGKKMAFIDNYGESLPDSAWRTHAIYPKQLLKEAQRNKPINKKTIYGKSLLIDLKIDVDGNVTIENIKHEALMRVNLAA